jgi:hypothetical protein
LICFPGKYQRSGFTNNNFSGRINLTTFNQMAADGSAGAVTKGDMQMHAICESVPTYERISNFPAKLLVLF